MYGQVDHPVSWSHENAVNDRPALEGCWCGYYTYSDDPSRSDGLVTLMIDSADLVTKEVTGRGLDMWGPFQINGTVIEKKISFTKVYLRSNSRQCDGVINEDLQGVTGMWSEQGNQPLGTFTFKRRPQLYFLSNPGRTATQENRYRALWQLAFRAAIKIVQSQRLSWKTLQGRRDLRREFILALFERGEKGGHPERWEEIVTQCSSEDLWLWRSLYDAYVTRCGIIHQG